MNSSLRIPPSTRATRVLPAVTLMKSSLKDKWKRAFLFYRETGCIQYLIEVGHITNAFSPTNYVGELLVNHSDTEDLAKQAIDSNMEAFYYLLRKAAGGDGEVEGAEQFGFWMYYYWRKEGG